MSVKPRVICLAGPTASGKTAAALALAREHPVEIISVDSALVYRGMDIGTAKPTHEELSAVPHHLINIRDPRAPYSAASFVTDAQALIHEITARGKLPLLVGGTLLYFKALIDGLDDMPRADAAIRAQLELEARQHGWPAMHALLAEVDPVTAARLNPADAQRVQRALEVYRASGQPMSSFHTSKIVATSAIDTPARGQKGLNLATTHLIHEMDPVGRVSRRRNPTLIQAHGCRVTPAANPTYEGAEQLPNHAANDLCLISLEPQDRAWLHERIAQRFDAMLASGFLDEVRALRARGDLHPDLPAMRCVGYRQAWIYLDALEAHATGRASGVGSAGGAGGGRSSGGAGKLPALSELRDQGIFATRQLAKRQLTWLRSMPQRQVVACDQPHALEQVLEKARDFLQTPPGAPP